MDKPVYKVTKFNLIGGKLFTYELLNSVRSEKFQNKNEQDEQRFVFKDDGREYPKSHLFTLTTSLAKYPKDKLFDVSETKLLPYFADVTQDLPGSIKFEPKTYNNCQLMAKKHGGCLQFLDHNTGEVLRIAMNSNIYQPTSL